MKHGKVFALIGCLLCFLFKGYSINDYHALIGCVGGFLAADSEGRLDWFTSQGDLTNSLKVASVGLNALLQHQGSLFVAGDSGTLLISSDTKTFRKLTLGSHATLFSLASFHNRILVGSEQGLLLVGDLKDSFQPVSLALEGNIVSLSATEKRCFGVTDKGEILYSTEDNQWKIIDFNTYYKGYYKPCRFTSILVTEHQIAIAGVNEDGTPALYLSAEGTIWSERTLNFSNEQQANAFLEEQPVSMSYDALEDQLLLVCNGGVIMKIPSCSHCNQRITVSTKNLAALAQRENNWLVVGSDHFKRALPAGWK